MKIARVFACILASIGVVLLIGSMVFLLLNQDASVRIQELPQEAERVSEAFAQALNEGDLTAAALCVYGQPDFGAEGTSLDGETVALWNAFLDSISLEFAGKYQAAGSDLTRSATITTLNIASVTEKLPERTQFLVNQKIASAENTSDVYDESGKFREELMEEILQQALQQALAQDAKSVSRTVTVKLVERDGAWWVVPDQALLQAISPVA